MHPQNPHLGRYDFPSLIKANPELNKFVIKSPRGEETINFDDPLAVLSLNRAILAKFYNIQNWDVPKGYLCPPIPGRADYLFYVRDLFPSQVKLHGLDVGVGANCIYPLIGSKALSWSFVGSDIDKTSFESAKQNVINNHLSGSIEIRHQEINTQIFLGIIKSGEKYDFTICNPPFHASKHEAEAGSQRKRKNLNLSSPNKLNFGGQHNELWTDGGERKFVSKMIEESVEFAHQVTWFTCLISKEENLKPLMTKLEKLKNKPILKIIDMSQGQKKSRILAWSFKGESN